jgi:hypothetical protein
MYDRSSTPDFTRIFRFNNHSHHFINQQSDLYVFYFSYIVGVTCRLMEGMPRHQCLIYDGSPAKMLPAIAAHIKQRLTENVRCLYLNSPAMAAGLRSHLFAIDVNVAEEVATGRLILSSDQSHLKNGQFDADQMLKRVEEAVSQALNDGCNGLWATGDMTWELGRDRNLKKLVEYEWNEQAVSKVCRVVRALPISPGNAVQRHCMQWSDQSSNAFY